MRTKDILDTVTTSFFLVRKCKSDRYFCIGAKVHQDCSVATESKYPAGMLSQLRVEGLVKFVGNCRQLIRQINVRRISKYEENQQDDCVEYVALECVQNVQRGDQTVLNVKPFDKCY